MITGGIRFFFKARRGVNDAFLRLMFQVHFSKYFYFIFSFNVFGWILIDRAIMIVSAVVSTAAVAANTSSMRLFY